MSVALRNGTEDARDVTVVATSEVGDHAASLRLAAGRRRLLLGGPGR
jgi:hypothetical protein